MTEGVSPIPESVTLEYEVLPRLRTCSSGALSVQHPARLDATSSASRLWDAGLGRAAR
jgi:hypothetical protein